MAVYLKNDTTRTSLSEKAKKCEKLQKNYLLRTDKKNMRGWESVSQHYVLLFLNYSGQCFDLLHISLKRMCNRIVVTCLLTLYYYTHVKIRGQYVT